MQTLRDYALSFVGRFYIWGGDDPDGFDCSGISQEILASVGLDPPGDQTAQGLFNHFSVNGSHNVYGLGALAFYGESTTKITHVGFCIDQYRMLEAGGGGPQVKTHADAIRHNAFIRIRLIKGRKDLVAVVKPYYRTIAAL